MGEVGRGKAGGWDLGLGLEFVVDLGLDFAREVGGLVFDIGVVGGGGGVDGRAWEIDSR